MAAQERFGLWTLTFLVIASMVGAGVFTTSGFTLQHLGTPRLVVAAWVVGGLIALAGAVSYGQLARAMPESGGEYLFLTRAAHPLLGFIAGWVSLIAGFTGAIAFAATALEGYILPEGLRPSWLPTDSLAVAVVILVGVCHGLRPRGGAMLQNAAVILKLGVLAVFLGLAAYKLPSNTWHGGPLTDVTSSTWSLVAAFATSLVWIALSYSGFNAAVYVIDEAKSPTNSVPKALLIGTITTMALYVLLNAVFVYAPPPTSIAGMPDVAAIAAEWLGGKPVSLFVRVIIALALLTSVSSMVMAAPRVYAKMADDGLLPKFLRSRDGAPRYAIAAQVLFAIVIIRVSTLHGLLSYLGLTLSLCAACSVGCLFLPSVRRKPFLHVSHLPPLIYITCTLAAAVIMTAHNPAHLIGTLLTVSVGALVYAAVPGKRSSKTNALPKTHSGRE